MYWFRMILFGIVFFSYLGPTLASNNAVNPLIMGLHPNISARTILVMYQPMREYLEKELGQPIELYSAPDFRTYMRRTLNQEYDIAVTAPHLARLAQKRGGYVPLVYYLDKLHGIFIVANHSPLRKISDLRGKTIAIPDPLTIISIMGLEFLHSHGLDPAKDIKLFLARSHNNAAISVESGESDAAIIGSVPYEQLPIELKSRLRIIASTASIPSQFIVASPKLPPDKIERIKAALLKFSVTPQGKEFLNMNGFGGLLPANESVLKTLDRYLPEVDRLLHE